jgi:hypothetical protein
MAKIVCNFNSESNLPYEFHFPKGDMFLDKQNANDLYIRLKISLASKKPLNLLIAIMHDDKGKFIAVRSLLTLAERTIMLEAIRALSSAIKSGKTSCEFDYPNLKTEDKHIETQKVAHSRDFM